MASYYIANGNNRRGPYSLEELPAQGLRPEMLVWTEGMADWAPASSVPELQPLLNIPPGGQVPPPPPGGYGQQGYPQASYGQGPYMSPDISSTKLAAGLCGIFLGAFGIHKFILGMTKPAVIMLLVSLVTCGVGGAVMGVVGLIEGIIYLTKPDQEFYRIYMVEKKEWF